MGGPDTRMRLGLPGSCNSASEEGESPGPDAQRVASKPRSGAIIHSISGAARRNKSGKPVSSDDYTLVRIANGDPSAVADCMKRFSGLVWSLVRSKLGNSAEAEDLTQEIFVEIWKSAARFNPEAGSESVFIATIARRRIIDRLRYLGRRPETEEFDETSSVGQTAPEQHIAADAARAHAALQNLKEDQRSLILMGVVEGMTHSEIATATGKPLGTVKTQMRRGLAKVRAMLEDEDESGMSGAASG
jgi:RNA polymerase sigma-70 factor (ECF subfamily)